NTSQNMDSWLVKGTLKFSEDHQLEIAHLGYRNIYGQSMPSMTQISFIPDWNKQLEPARAAQDNYTARYRWNPRDNDLIDLKANAYTAHLNNQTMMNAQTQANINAGVEPFMSSRIRTSGLDISNTSRFSPAWGDMSLTYGAAYMNEDVAPLQTNAESSFLSSNGTRQTAAVFANGEWSPWRWLTIDAGLRYDSFKTRDRADPNDLLQPGYGNASPALAGHSLEGHGVSPHASVTLKPFDGVQLYAMYVEGFRAPNIWEATNNVIALNPDLKPERAKNWEIGANFSRDNVIRNGDKARLKVSYFDNTIHDIIVRDYFFTSPPPGGTFYYRRNNYDRARFSGVEVSGKYDSGKVFADFSATYYTRVEYCRNRYPNVPGEYYWAAYGYGCQNGPYANDYMSNQVPPQFSASALLGVRLFDDRLTLSGRITHMGDRAGSYIDYILPSTMWTAYNVYDAFLSYKVDDTWTVNVSAENLTDRYYFKPLSQATLPAPGRTIRATLTGTFDASAAAKRRDADPADASAAGDWTGFYVGTHLGYGIGRDARQMTSITGASDALAAGETANHAFKDINRGLQVGYNYQLTNRVVLGLESDISWLGYDRSWEDVSTEAPTSPNKLQATVDTSLNWLATLRGRIGYAIDDSLMLYATGGAAFLNQTEKRTQFRMTDPLGAGSIPAFEENASATRVGLSLGAGAEYQIGGGWSLKGEYMFAGFGEDIFKFRNARTGVNPGGTAFDFTLPGCNLFFNPMTCMVNIPSTSDGVSGRKLTSSIDIHMLKFGINYRF
ncbi:MAG: TonB-dependent receptor, partial [Hyphomicrobiaceae bacterium]